MRTARFEVYEAKDGWRWRFKAKNGRIIATGESHKQFRHALRSVETVRETMRSLTTIYLVVK